MMFDKYANLKYKFGNRDFWAEGYYVSAVGLNEVNYIYFPNNDYKGCTAKFTRNGHIYYAEFDRNSLSKLIYGEKHNSLKGYKALINTGDDGEIFNLIEENNYRLFARYDEVEFLSSEKFRKNSVFI